MDRIGRAIAIVAGGLIIAGVIHDYFLSIDQPLIALLSAFAMGCLTFWPASKK